MAVARRWHWKMAAMRQHWEVALGSGLRLWQRRWAAVAEEDHATMVFASATSKLRASYYNIGISVSKDGERGCVQCEGRTSTAMARR